MQIVIDIPEEDYEYLKLHNKDGLYNAILNGKPLPKGHGRLIDSTKLEDIIQEKGFNSPLINPVFGMMQVFEMIDDVPTVIEADKEEGAD